VTGPEPPAGKGEPADADPPPAGKGEPAGADPPPAGKGEPADADPPAPGPPAAPPPEEPDDDPVEVLRPGERAVKRTGWKAVLVGLLPLTYTVHIAFTTDFGGIIYLLMALVLVPAVLLFGRAALLTDHRVVTYAPGLAALARRFPFLRRLERRWRRSADLADVTSVDVRGQLLVLKTPGREHTVRCDSKAEARELLLQVQELRRARALGRDRERADAVAARVRVTAARAAAPASAVRCPYCHGDLDPAEGRPCPSCATPHHEDCLAVHGRCAVFGCGGRPGRIRVRA